MPKPKKAPPVLSKEQEEKEKAPAVTVGMGFKMSKVSSDNWRAQVRKEQQIRREWIRTHAPELDSQEQESVRRFHDRQIQLATIRGDIKERELLTEGVSKEGQGRVHYLKERNKLAPQDKCAVPVTEQQVLGWQSMNSDLVRSRLTGTVEVTKKPRSKPHNIVEQELEAGGWCQLPAGTS